MAFKVLGPDGAGGEGVLVKRTCPPPRVRGQGGKKEPAKETEQEQAVREEERGGCST